MTQVILWAMVWWTGLMGPAAVRTPVGVTTQERPPTEHAAGMPAPAGSPARRLPSSVPPEATPPLTASPPLPSPPPASAGLTGLIRARIETSMGDVVVELDADRAPMSVANFLRYAEEGFYNGTVIHRVIPHFLIQGGGYVSSYVPKTQGLHDPIVNEWNNGLKNVRLTIGAARVPGKPHSATTQFYINVADNPRLDQAQEDGAGYAVFGRVVAGEDVVEKIRTTPLKVNSRYQEPSGKPVTPVRSVLIRCVRILRGEDEVVPPPSEPTPPPPGETPTQAPETPTADPARPTADPATPLQSEGTSRTAVRPKGEKPARVAPTQEGAAEQPR